MALSPAEYEWLENFLNAAEENHNDIRGTRAREFVDDQRKRFEEYHADMNLSPKQWKWLKDIAADIGHEVPEDVG